MRLHRPVPEYVCAIAFGVLVGAIAVACDDVDDGHGALNAPCTRDRDCESALTCIDGVCTARAPTVSDDAGDAGAKDAGDGE